MVHDRRRNLGDRKRRPKGDDGPGNHGGDKAQGHRAGPERSCFGSATHVGFLQGRPPDVLASPYDGAMRGDRVEVTIDIGSGVKVYDVIATRAGRRVEVTTGRTIVEVAEVTRSGTPVRTARFMTSRMVALVEHPAQAG